MPASLQTWYRSGQPWVWLTAAAVSASIVMVVGLLLLISVRGLSHFWPKPIIAFDYTVPGAAPVHVIGSEQESEALPAERVRGTGVKLPDDVTEVTRRLIKTGNRDVLGLDFGWYVDNFVSGRSEPPDLAVVERREWGDFHGYLRELKSGGVRTAGPDTVWNELPAAVERAHALFAQIRHLEKDDIGEINYKIERLRLQARRLELAGDTSPEPRREIEAARAALEARYGELQAELKRLHQDLGRDVLLAEASNGRMVEIPLAKVVRVYQPNNMSMPGKLAHYASKLWEFVADDPREANTEGGIFPAIFGTVLMVIVMSIFVTPAGVIAAIYLREYARQGPLTRLIRIAVNNLAGVPSIVYGVFGLGFFVYFIGGNIDQLFYPEALPAPTFGSPGILWSSLTLAILTMPVVIVATEEGLSRIPSSIREGSLALGATKAETLWRTILPMASPAVMTGLILAIARAAGEVAPLMLVGVVKLAPSLALDGNAPFLHLERKFMHLGFHIYDVGFQSPNVEAARPLVYATSLLLVVVIIVLNLAAIAIRNHLREKYRALEGG